MELELELRFAAFAWLEEQVALHGDVLEGGLLRHGFEFRGQRVPLAVQQGIHKPRIIDGALSLRTSLDSPYEDHFEGADTLVYRYRGNDPDSWDNRAARFAYDRNLPLVYLHAVGDNPPRYAVIWPVYIVGDDPVRLAFKVQAELPALGVLSGLLGGASTTGDSESELKIKRAYGTRLARTRLHQASFRERVLDAYRRQCAMCHLRHPKLLEAAHIVPDRDESGEPLVTNGLSLCRIHHGAFDVHYLSVEPDTYTIRVQPGILREEDGPMLRHGLQELHGKPLLLPHRAVDRPDPRRLAQHWEKFSKPA